MCRHSSVILFAALLAIGCDRPDDNAQSVELHKQTRDFEPAVDVIKELGGDVAYDEGSLLRVDLRQLKVTDEHLTHLTGLNHLQSLDLADTQITDVGLKHLERLTGLQTLNLTGTKVTDAGMDHLGSLTELRCLHIGWSHVTPAGLERLRGMATLRSLSLGSGNQTSAGFEHLAGLTSLRTLCLRWTLLTDADLAHVKGLTRLQSLNLTGTKITDAGLRHLKGLKSLRCLILEQTQVTDSGLEHLKGLTGLQSLDLSDTHVGDTGLKHLRRFTDLRYLALDRTNVTDAGLERLRRQTSLLHLHLNSTRVTDTGLEYLTDLTSLLRLDLGNSHPPWMYIQGRPRFETEVTDVGITRLKQTLPNCRVHPFDEGQSAVGARELEVYSVAVEYFLADSSSQSREIAFLTVDGGEAPQELLSTRIRPGSFAEWFGEAAHSRVRDKNTGEFGSEVSVRIQKWIGPELVVVSCNSVSGGLWGGGCDLLLRFENGHWIPDRPVNIRIS